MISHRSSAISDNDEKALPQVGLGESDAYKRIKLRLAGRDASWLAREADVSTSTLNDIRNGKTPRTDRALRIAAALGSSVEWLFAGIEPSRSTLRSADQSDWIDVPEYNLVGITDDSLGEPMMTVPVRRDWLNATFRTSSGIWVARLPWDYRPAELEEGTIVFCRSLPEQELADRNVCIWRVDENVVIGRYAVRPADRGLPPASEAGGIKHLVPPGADGALAYIAPPGPAGAMLAQSIRIPDDLIVTRDMLDEYHLVGRVIGVFMRPVRYRFYT